MLGLLLSFALLRSRGGLLCSEEVAAAGGVVVDEFAEFSCWLALLPHQGELCWARRSALLASPGYPGSWLSRARIPLGTLLVR